jgi:hypothetical protein
LSRLDWWPATGGGYAPLPPIVYDRACGDMISQKDPRFGWTAIYSRKPGDTFAHAVVFALQSRTKGQFDPTDLARVNNAPGTAKIDPKIVTVTQMLDIANGVDRVTIAAPTPEISPAVTGAFLVIGQGPFAGRIYRLGNQLPLQGGSLTFELQPGYDVKSPAENIATPVQAWLVGKANVGTPQAPNYAGYAMDIAAYPTTIRLGYFIPGP